MYLNYLNDLIKMLNEIHFFLFVKSEIFEELEVIEKSLTFLILTSLTKTQE
jgi:hypothetical protein